jgi:hypothetical protein
MKALYMPAKIVMFWNGIVSYNFISSDAKGQVSYCHHLVSDLKIYLENTWTKLDSSHH